MVYDSNKQIKQILDAARIGKEAELKTLLTQGNCIGIRNEKCENVCVILGREKNVIASEVILQCGANINDIA